ncbi:MAG TPA: capsule biosynthesis protein, partial [Chitinophagaceae bacterium]|nr:capsule biosynthesis protein [Chitinophagaceae bacterium]
MKSALTKIYPGITNGSIGLQVSLAQLRTIKVTLIGEVVWPGNYELSSFATLMNALYVSGGPNKIGSFRDIELVRHGKTVVKFDLYDFLLKSDLTKNLILNDGDVIRINPYSNRIILKGAVKKPALFDVQPQESAADIIRYAGGFADIAYKEWIRVYRMGLRNKEIISVPQQQLSSFRLQTGDTLVVDSLANQYANRVTISGAVYYGGAYSLQQLPSLKDLLQAARLREDVFMNRGVIKRLKQDFTPEIIAFDISKGLSDDERILLQREDSVQVFRITDLREQYAVTINGEVNKPG